MVKAYAKVPALAILVLVLGTWGCGSEIGSRAGEGEGLVEAAEARAPAKTSPAEAAPVRRPAPPGSDSSLAASPSVDRERADERTGAPARAPARPPTLQTPPPPVAEPLTRPRVERRLPDLEPPDRGWPYPDEPREDAITVPAGTLLELRAETLLSSRRAWPGDRVQARLVDDVLDPDGMVLVPRGAVVEGVVSRVVRADEGDGDPGLELEVRALIMDGRVYDLDARVTDVELEVRRVRDGREMAGKAAAGAAAGAILGKILGKDAKSTIAGAVAGATAGAAVAAATAETEAVLEEGARLEVVLRTELILDPE